MKSLPELLRADIPSAYERLDRYDPNVNKAFYRTVARMFDAYVALKLDSFKVLGGENIPKKGAFLAMPNHASHMDHAFVGKPVLDYTGRPMRFIAKEGFWKNKWAPVTARFVERGGAVPVQRNSGLGLQRQHGLANMLETAFERGQGITIYPQGTRVPGVVENGVRSLPAFEKVKKGGAQIAIAHQIPVQPIGIAGAEDLDSVVIRFDKLLMPPVVENPSDPREIAEPARLFTEEIMDHISDSRDISLQRRAITQEFLQTRRWS